MLRILVHALAVLHLGPGTVSTALIRSHRTPFNGPL